MNRVEVGIGVILAAAGGAVALGAPGVVFAGVVAGLVLLVGIAAARPGLGWFGPARTHVRPAGIALTIDDGPDPQTTPALLAALAAAQAHATFFFLADRARAHPDLVAAAVAGGHEVGLHGLSHSWGLTVWSPRRGEAWVRAGARALVALGAGPVRRFRPPFGVVSPRLVAAVRASGLELTWGSVRTGDGVALDGPTLRARQLAARPGDVVLVHDGNPVTVAVLPEVLAAWSGVRVGSVAELA